MSNPERGSLQAEITRLTKFPVVENLLRVSDGVSKYLHSTPGDSDESIYLNDIMINGLNCRNDGLGGVAILLSGNKANDIAHLAYRHGNYPIVVTIVLPNPDRETEARIKEYRNTRTFRRPVWIDSLLVRKISGEQRESAQHNFRYNYIIEGKFIEGFFDTQTGEFTKNPIFDPTLSAEDIRHMFSRLEELSKPKDFC